jgi:UDPglucose 6-dehydrogenase|tara:strand:+ start:1003 stop:1797 length:795 start_codon:yes stop_codon:yes gene_type:complete
MKIGVLGLGVVGNAVYTGFSELGHSMSFYDPAKDSKFEDVLETEICFICVPTPPNEEGFCDTTIVEESIQNLLNNNYQGIVVIKSTVEPGTTEALSKKYTDLEIAFVPEFLRERCAVVDFIENHDLCIIGTETQECYEKIKEAHGSYPENFRMLTRTEAELVKYYNNIYNATLITLANSFYEVCKDLGASYTKIKNSLVLREHVNDSYLQCNENFRGFGGVCLPKDTLAIAKLVEKNNLDVNFFKMILEENKKYKVTVYDGMRK